MLYFFLLSINLVRLIYVDTCISSWLIFTAVISLPLFNWWTIRLLSDFFLNYKNCCYKHTLLISCKHVWVLLVYVCVSEISGAWDIYVFNFMRHCKTARRCDCINLHWPAMYKNSLGLHILTNSWFYVTCMCTVGLVSGLICISLIADDLKTFLLVFISHLQFLFCEWLCFSN